MSIVITTDVFCDQCGRWAYYESGDRAVPAEARAAAIEDGWKFDRHWKSTCPACLGTKPGYFSSISGSPHTIPPRRADRASKLKAMGLENASLVPVTELFEAARSPTKKPFG